MAAAVQRFADATPPLGWPACDAPLNALKAAIGTSKAAWEHAVELGAYTQLVRCLLAAPNDPGLQANVLAASSELAQSERPGKAGMWRGFAEAVLRAGAMAPVVAALRTFSHDEPDVVLTASTVLESFLTGSASLAAAREARAAEALVGCLRLALATADEDEGMLVLVVISTLGTLLRCDAASVLQVAKPETLSLLALAVIQHGHTYEFLGRNGVISMHRIVFEVPALATDAVVAQIARAQRRVLMAFEDTPDVQLGIWCSLFLVMNRDESFAERVAQAGLAADAVRSLRRVGDGETKLVEKICESLLLLLRVHARSRETAVETGVVDLLSTALRVRGPASASITKAACAALSNVIQADQIFAPDALLRGQLPPLLPDLVTVLRAHSGNADVLSVALPALARVCLALSALAAEVRRPPPSELARRMAETGALDVAAAALREHAATAASLWVASGGLEAILCLCAGSPSDDVVEPLQASVAARAVQAGAAAALTAALERTKGTEAEANPAQGWARTLLKALERAAEAMPKPRACENCGTTDAPKLMLCGRCRNARFCGAECQRAAWPAHKAACKATVSQQAAAGSADTKLARS